MRKLIIALTLAAGSFYAAHAQKPYIRLGFGYGFPHAGQTRDIDGTPLNGTGTYSSGAGFTSLEMKKASYAAGATANIALGIMINANIGLELNGILGVATKQYTSVFSINDNGDKIDERFITQARLPVLLNPSLMVQTGKKVCFYMRAGIALPLHTTLTSDGTAGFQQASNGAAYTFKRTTTYYTVFHPGITGDMGLNFQLIKHLRFFCEAHLLSMSLYLKQAHIDNPSTTVTYRTQSHGGPIDAGTYSLPFSSIGGNGGLIFEL